MAPITVKLKPSGSASLFVNDCMQPTPTSVVSGGGSGLGVCILHRFWYCIKPNKLCYTSPTRHYGEQFMSLYNLLWLPCGRLVVVPVKLCRLFSRGGDVVL